MNTWIPLKLQRFVVLSLIVGSTVTIGVFSSIAKAAECTSMGGTTVDGCLAPLVQWSDGFSSESRYADKVTAAWANYKAAKDQGQCPDCNRGIQTTPITYTNWTGWNCSGSPPTATDNVYTTYSSSGGGNTSFSVEMYGYKTQTICGAPRQVYVSSDTGHWSTAKINCPINYEVKREFIDNINEPFGYACQPPTNINNIIGSCESGAQNPEGLCTYPNPVLFTTKAKIGTVVDITTTGPRPIAWSRTYSSHRGGIWHFPGLEKNLTINTASDGTKRVVANRGTSQYIFYKSTNNPNSATAHIWVSNMATSSQPYVQLIIKDRFVSGNRVGFDLIQQDGTVEEYSLTGILQRDINQRGYAHHYTHDSLGRITSINDDYDHEMVILYAPNTGYLPFTVTYDVDDGHGGVTPVTDTLYGTSPSGDAVALARNVIGVTTNVNGIPSTERSIGYAWSINSGSSTIKKYNLTAFTDPDGVSTTYGYGETLLGTTQKINMWTGIIDGEGRRTRTYNYGSPSSVNVDSEWQGGTIGGVNAKRTMTFSTNNVEDARGNRTYFTQDGVSKKIKTFTTQCWWCSGSLSYAKSIAYDAAGNPTTITDFDNIVDKRTYDGSNRLLTKTEAFGTGLAKTTTLTYSGSLRSPATIVEPTVVGSAPHTRTTTTTRNSDGRLTGVVISTSSGEPSRSTSYSYNGDGLLSSFENAKGVVTDYVYNSAGQVVEITEAVGTALERTTFINSYSNSGQPTSVTFPNSITVFSTWSDSGKLLSTTTPGHGVISYEYDDAGLLVATINADATSDHIGYTDSGVPITLTHKDSNGATVSVTSLTLDIMDETIGTSLVNSSAQVVFEKTRTLNALNREVTVIGANGQTTTKTYNGDGQETVTVEPMARTTTRVIDALGRVTQITDPGTGVSSIAYDIQNNPVLADDARGVSTEYGYNGFDEVIALTSPDRGTWSLAYDNAGNITSVIDPRGVDQQFSYDELDRPTSIVFDDSGVTGSPPGFTAGTITRTMVYDSCSNGIGKICSSSDASGSDTWSYDTYGRIIGLARYDAPTGITINTQYGYDSIGRITSVTYPSGKILVVDYNANGQVETLTYAGQEVVEDIAWRADGQLASFIWGDPDLSGGGQTFTYDKDGQPEEITSSFTTSNYTLDAAGRITAIAETDTTYNQNLSYSPMDRLLTQTSTNAGGVISYTYDSTGNRLSVLDSVSTGQNTAVQSTSNRLTSITPVVSGAPGTPAPVSHDALGNVIAIASAQSLSYNSMGNLSAWTDGSVSAGFTYNSNNLRASENVTTASTSDRTLNAYDLNGRLIGVYKPDGSGGFTVVEELISLDGWRIIATVRPDVSSGMAAPVIHPIVTNHLQSPVAILSPSTGLPVWIWHATEAFGSGQPDTNPNGYGVFLYDGRFAGQRFDQTTQFTNNGYRDYASSLGRYIQSDPIGLSAGWNTYSYADGNPINYNDPFGLWATEAHDKIIKTAFPFLANNLILEVSKGSQYVDRMESQISGDPAEHAMRKTKNDSVLRAKQRTCEFIKAELVLYNTGKNSKNKQIQLDAYNHLGRALHPVMDSTSPMHRGWKIWDYFDLDATMHGSSWWSRENERKLTPELLKETVDLINSTVNEDPCACIK